MIRRHLKRMAVPRTWDISRKENTFITRPKPGPHSLEEGIALGTALKSLLDYAHTTKEAKKILMNRNIMIDGMRRKNHRFIIGLMDVISIPELKQNYRVIVNTKGKLKLIKIDEKDAKQKLSKIIGKTLVKDKIQLNLSDGKNILVDKKSAYKTGDSVVIEIPSQKIIQHLKLERNALVFIVKGKSSGQLVRVENIRQKEIACKKESGELIETRKQYVLVVGKEKSAITLTEK